MARKAAAGAGTIRKKTINKGGKQYIYWEARITTGTDPGTGRQIQKSFTGKTQKEVRDKLQAAAPAINNGVYIEPAKITLGQWLDKWLEGLYQQKFSTIKHYRTQVETHIKPCMGALKLSQLSKTDFDRFYKHLLSEGKEVKKKDEKSGKLIITHEPLSMKSVKNIHVILKGAIGAALDADMIQNDPMRKVTIQTPQRPEITTLTDEQVKDYIIASASDLDCGLMLKLIIFTGLREAEAMGLTWDCIDLKNGTITIKQQLQDRGKENGGMCIVPTKNSKTRILSPAPYVMDILKQQAKKQFEERATALDMWEGWKDEKERKTYFVFTNAFGGCFRPKTVYQHHKKICAAIGADCTVHDLRHTFAKLSLQNGDDPKTVQGNLGHATAAFTLDVYGHISEKMKDNSASRMQNYIDSLKAE